ncbi:MAG: enoyl-CoA hydratase-related protein [Alphaproteobacteria bacterium]
MTDAITVEKEDRIAWVYIDRPKAMNSIEPDTMKEMHGVFQALGEDDDVAVIVLAGAGKHFGAGYDLKFDWTGHYGNTVLGWRKMLQECVDFEFLPWDCQKPVIAMVRGYCLAGSCELAMMSCITIASEDAKFGEPEIRFSTSPPAIVMPWIVGLKKARELLYTGDLIDAAEAHRIGMVNKVVPEADLEAETRKLAKRIAAISPEGLLTTKSSINQTAEIAGFRTSIAYGINQGAMLDASETQALKEFSRIREAEGLTAAIRWRESQFE